MNTIRDTAVHLCFFLLTFAFNVQLSFALNCDKFAIKAVIPSQTATPYVLTDSGLGLLRTYTPSGDVWSIYDPNTGQLTPYPWVGPSNNPDLGTINSSLDGIGTVNLAGIYHAVFFDYQTQTYTDLHNTAPVGSAFNSYTNSYSRGLNDRGDILVKLQLPVGQAELALLIDAAGNEYRIEPASVGGTTVDNLRLMSNGSVVGTIGFGVGGATTGFAFTRPNNLVLMSTPSSCPTCYPLIPQAYSSGGEVLGIANDAPGSAIYNYLYRQLPGVQTLLSPLVEPTLQAPHYLHTFFSNSRGTMFGKIVGNWNQNGVFFVLFRGKVFAPFHKAVRGSDGIYSGGLGLYVNENSAMLASLWRIGGGYDYVYLEPSC